MKGSRSMAKSIPQPHPTVGNQRSSALTTQGRHIIIACSGGTFCFVLCFFLVLTGKVVPDSLPAELNSSPPTAIQQLSHTPSTAALEFAGEGRGTAVGVQSIDRAKRDWASGDDGIAGESSSPAKDESTDSELSTSLLILVSVASLLAVLGVAFGLALFGWRRFAPSEDTTSNSIDD